MTNIRWNQISPIDFLDAKVKAQCTWCQSLHNVGKPLSNFRCLGDTTDVQNIFSNRACTNSQAFVRIVPIKNNRKLNIINKFSLENARI